MRRRRAILAAVLALPVQSATAQPARDPSRELDAYVAQAVKDWNVAGFAIAVVYHGRVVFAKGYGLREMGRPEPVDTSTLFAMGSTTKALTSAALGMLVDEGRLRWDDPVTRHLPWFQLYDPYATREVTIRDLLTHRAGLPESDYLWDRGDVTRNEVVRRLRFLPPARSFRAGYEYQNVMVTAAGAVLEAVSGVSWDDFVTTRIFQPLGMSRSVTTQAAARLRDNRAAPHWIRNDSAIVIENSWADGIGPAGSAWSTASDMARWVRFLLDSGRVDGRPLLQPRTWAELFRPATIRPPTSAGSSPEVRLSAPHFRTYALGWYQQDYQGRQVDFHTGSLNGMVAMNGLVREEGIGVYMFGNTDHRELRHALMFKVFDLYLGLPTRDWSSEMLALYREAEARDDSAQQRAVARRITGTSPSLPPDRYAGTFADSLYGRAVVALENGVLRLRTSSRRAGTLEHWQFDTFRARWDEWWRGTTTVSFLVEPNGSPDRLEISGHTLRRVTDRGGRAGGAP